MNILNLEKKRIVQDVFAFIIASIIAIIIGVLLFFVFFISRDYLYFILMMALFFFGVILTVFSYRWDALYILIGLIGIYFFVELVILILHLNNVRLILSQLVIYHTIISGTIIIGTVMKLEILSFFTNQPLNQFTIVKEKEEKIIFKQMGYIKLIFISLSSVPGIISYFYLIYTILIGHPERVLAIFYIIIGYIQAIVVIIYVIIKLLYEVVIRNSILSITKSKVILKNRLGIIRRDLAWSMISKYKIRTSKNKNKSYLKFKGKDGIYLQFSLIKLNSKLAELSEKMSVYSEVTNDDNNTLL